MSVNWRSIKDLNFRWEGYEFKGPAFTLFAVHDAQFETFKRDVAPVIPGFRVIEDGEPDIWRDFDIFMDGIR